jgi:plasmid stabilization system protein ParE
MIYKIKIEPEALADIQDIINWYNQQKSGLGEKFHKTIIFQIDSLKKTAHIYSIRYKQIRCLLVNKFPYMIHFYINEEVRIVEVLAVISTFRNPKIWQEKSIKKT